MEKCPYCEQEVEKLTDNSCDECTREILEQEQIWDVYSKGKEE